MTITYAEQLDAARQVVIRHQWASYSLLQRKLQIGLARAMHIVADLEREGVVAPYEGLSSRRVLIQEGS